MVVLYQLAISHYCEKIRWALDYKQLDHRTESLLPGLHVAKTKKMGLKQSGLPVVRHGDKVIQNSSVYGASPYAAPQPECFAKMCPCAEIPRHNLRRTCGDYLECCGD